MNAPRAAHAACLYAAVASLYLFPARSHAIDFAFYFNDGAGQGFLEPTGRDQRMAALQAAARSIGNLIAPTYLGETVNVRVSTYNDPNTVNLGSARSEYFYDGFSTADPRFQSNTHYVKALASHLHGANVEVGHHDIAMTVNLGKNFYFGADSSVPAGMDDFVTLAVHELIHGLGFADSFRAQGGFGLFGDGTFDTNSGQSGLPTIYDRFVNLGPGTNSPVLSLSTDDRVAALVSNNLFWTGAGGTGANAGVRPRLNAPATFSASSSVAHLDPGAHMNNLMNPGLNTGTAIPIDPVVRGMLRDMGWNISVSSSTVTWNAGGATNLASTNANWSNPTYANEGPLPGDNLEFRNNAPAVYDVKMDLQLYSLGQIEFTPTAPAYTLRFRSYTQTDLTGAGVVNGSTAAHTFVLETYSDDIGGSGIVPPYRGRAATINFRNASTASNTTFDVRGGFTALNQAPNTPTTYTRFAGGAVRFYDTASADHATFVVQGASGDGAPGTHGSVTFHNNASADEATFTNLPGRPGDGVLPNGNPTIEVGWGGTTAFRDTSNAGFAIFNNVGQNASPSGNGTAGITEFHDASSAKRGTFNNLGATITGGFGGNTDFSDSSTADKATLHNNGGIIESGNGGATHFANFASAGDANIFNHGGATMWALGGLTAFTHSSNAGTAEIRNEGPAGLYAYHGRTVFMQSASAASAVITNLPSAGSPTTTDFHQTSTAGSATITNQSGAYPTVAGITTFRDSSNAGIATLNNQPSGQFNFRDSASADRATVNIFGGQTQFTQTSTAGQATLFLRSTTDGRVIFYDDSTAGTANIDIGALFLGDSNQSNLVQFYGRSTAASSTITVRGDGGSISFAGTYDPAGLPSATAGNAVIVALGSIRPGALGGSTGGQVQFNSFSTAGNATITAQPATVSDAPGGSIVFLNGGHAGNATLIANGGATPANRGLIRFQSGGAGDSARIVVNAGAAADFSNNAFHGGTSVGSLEGAGTFYIGASLLTVGNVHTSTTVSGIITETGGFSLGTGGRLTKVGTGTLTLSGANSYTGLTTVAEGTLAMNGSSPGPVAVLSGATLKGTGNFTGAMDIQPGAIYSPGLSPGTFTSGPLTLGDTSRLVIELGPTPATSDHLIVNGNLILDGILDLSFVSGATLTNFSHSFLTFTGTLTDNGLQFGSLPPGLSPAHFALSTFTPGHLSLIRNIPGDANLSGLIDPDDFALLDRGFSLHLTGRHNGDFNLDGAIDQADYLILDQSFLAQSPTFTPELFSQRESQFGPRYVAILTASIPEPAIALPAILSLLFKRRRPRP